MFATPVAGARPDMVGADHSAGDASRWAGRGGGQDPDETSPRGDQGADRSSFTRLVSVVLHPFRISKRVTFLQHWQESTIGSKNWYEYNVLLLLLLFKTA